jgi:hypothetical protein
MNDILGHIIDNTKDTILIRAFHFVNKYWHMRAARRLVLLGGRPHINIRMIYEYNMFIIYTQRTWATYSVMYHAHKRLLDYHPKCLLHCEFYRTGGVRDVMPYGSYCNGLVLHEENWPVFMLIFDYHDSIAHRIKGIHLADMW